MIERSSDDDSIGGRIPRPLSQDADSDLQKWLTELQTAADEVDSGVDDARVSSQIQNASGGTLDELGKDFGPLGKRRGRTDSQYRSFLLGLVGAFDGRGTARGIRTAVAAGVLADLEDVSLIEDESALEYEVVLKNGAWEPHQSGAVRELADLADPSVVQLRDPVHNRLPAAPIGIGSGATEINSGTELETAAIGIDASDTEHEVINSERTFGVDRFDGDGTFS